ncbi:hypothetical protein IPA_05560 [Ignicoccus pacificus DSM 13166]|uniref:Glycosyl transferase family 1 domain-containing protein n=1 Tax=Ignicoccus pacificus DSM 13166 TaxID=940294 RepID=A0A977PLM8_9CREN|nr:hypothetical protein IPA_05560 [Ignicoccus pacificus DSM 13166]
MEMAKGLKEVGHEIFFIVEDSPFGYASETNRRRLKELKKISEDALIVSAPKVTNSVQKISLGLTSLQLMIKGALFIKKNKLNEGVFILARHAYSLRKMFSKQKAKLKLSIIYDLVPLELSRMKLFDSSRVEGILKVLKSSIEASDALIVSTKHTYEQLRKALNVNKPYLLFPPPLRDLPRLDVQTMKRILRTYGISGRSTLSYLGSLEPKRLYPLIRMLDGLSLIDNNFEFVLMGCFREDELELVKASVPSNVDLKVIRCPPDAVSVSVISVSRAFVFPTLAEGFGIPPLEALSLRTKVVLPRIPPFTEIYPEDCIFFVKDPMSPRCWKEAINNALEADVPEYCFKFPERFKRRKLAENFTKDLERLMNEIQPLSSP